MLLPATLAPPHSITPFSHRSFSSSRCLSLSLEALPIRSRNPSFVHGVRLLRLMSQPSRSFSTSSHALGCHFSSIRCFSSCETDFGTSSNIVSETSSSNFIGESGVLIVGPGVLGKLVAEKWQQEYSGCHIFGQTMTTEHHDELVKLGIKPSLRGRSDMTYPNIIFCAPPRTADYPGDVRVAISNWNGEGSFLFTSSTAVYDCNDKGLCDEDYPVVPIGRSPRTDVLLKAENAVLEAGGCVLRLAGLYTDAASLAIAIMKRKFRGRTFLACDNNPISRGELMDCVNRSGKYSDTFQGFTGNGHDNLGKRMNNSKTRAEIGWEPKYSSFSHFLDQAS